MRINKWVIYALILILGTGILLLFWFYKTPSQKTNEFISLLGTFLELYALTITFIELVSVKAATEQIRTSIEETKLKFQSILSLSDISRSSKTIEEIQAYLGNGKLEMAYLRLKDLRKVLIESDTKTLFAQLPNQEEISICNAQVFSDINDLHSSIYHQKQIDLALVSNNLEKLALVFTYLEQKIKTESV